LHLIEHNQIGTRRNVVPFHVELQSIGLLLKIKVGTAKSLGKRGFSDLTGTDNGHGRKECKPTTNELLSQTRDHL
jgi:hypothetical protein